MTAATLNEVLAAARDDKSAVVGFVVFGLEDAKAYVEAAEMTERPIILQAGPGCRKHTPIPILGQIFRHLADAAKVPVVCHIDHARTYDECAKAVECGFTSLMIDGSALPLEDNIELTSRVVALGRRHGLSVEGEIGAVGYQDGAQSSLTDVYEAERFGRETKVDALAISIGNLHLQTDHAAKIDLDRLQTIEAVTTMPLVLHGASGIDPVMRRLLATEHQVKKFNIGTEFRQEFGRSLRCFLADHPAEFDRLKILSATIAPMRDLAVQVINNLAP
jgi:fructose-bisphosphate aldolase class II